MSILADWNGYQKELEDAIKAVLTAKQQPPKDAVALLKTSDLKDALKKADKAKQDNDIDEIRKAQAKTQKFFLMYANQFKLAKVAVKTACEATPNEDSFSNLNDTLNMFNAYMTRTQVAVAKLCSDMIKDAKAAETNDAKKLTLEIKAALSPLKFKYDWKAAKEDFEKETGRKKPSEKILGTFRKSSSLEKALDELDKACQSAEPGDYRKAYPVFTKASADYLKTLNAAIAADNTADDIYKKKCGGLKDVLSSIDSRAKEKIKLLDELNV